MPPHDPLAQQYGLDAYRVRALQGLPPTGADDQPAPLDGRLVEAAAAAYHVPPEAVTDVIEILHEPTEVPAADPLALELGLDSTEVRRHQHIEVPTIAEADPAIAERLIESVAIEAGVEPEHLHGAVVAAATAEARSADPLADALGLDVAQVRAHQGISRLETVPSTPGERYEGGGAFTAGAAA